MEPTSVPTTHPTPPDPGRRPAPDEAGPPAVDAVHVSKSYGSVHAVRDVSLRVGAGEVYGVLGPNGAGKTTLLRMLFGLISPDEGSISVFGRSWARDGVRTLEGVGGFIESPRFYPYLTGRQNLMALAGLDELGSGRAGGKARKALVEEVLALVHLDDRADRKVRGYSYGMKQRLGVAASLLRQPRLVVLDEPANGLDPAGIRDMRALVKRLADSGLTVLLSSHHMDEVEEICDNVTIMNDGAVAFHGSLGDLRAMAPDPGYVLQTGDDATARTLAERHASLSLSAADGGGIRVVGREAAVSDYVADVVRRGVPLRALTPTETPLEALFFMLTDTDPAQSPADQSPLARQEAAS